MSNVSDYLKWRGDLDFSQAPFNDVDNLILAQIAYVDFTDIVPAPGSICLLYTSPSPRDCS